jgi:hypothetical protein
MLSVIMFIVVILNVLMLSVIMLILIICSIYTLSFTMLSFANKYSCLVPLC